MRLDQRAQVRGREVFAFTPVPVPVGGGVGLGVSFGRERSVFRAGIRMFSNRNAPAVSKVSGAMVMPVDIYHVLIFNDVPDFSSQNFRIA